MLDTKGINVPLSLVMEKYNQKVDDMRHRIYEPVYQFLDEDPYTTWQAQAYLCILDVLRLKHALTLVYVYSILKTIKRTEAFV